MITGPPATPDHLVYLNAGSGMWVPFAKKSCAQSDLGVLPKYAPPWSLLVPDFNTRFVTPPSVLPKLASNVAVCTLNSCTRPWGGTNDAVTSPAFAVEVLGRPAMVTSPRFERPPFIP